jgi:RHS repeat-associated protein
VRSAGEDGLHEVRLRYHASGLTTVTKADGGEWQYIHERRRLSKIIDPYGGIREIILKPTGQIAREVDPSGNVREYVYDETAALAGTKDVFGRLRPARLEGRSEPFDRPYTPRTPIEWDLGGGLAFSAYRLPGASSDALRQLPPEVAKRVRRASHEAEDAPRVAPLLKPTGPPKIPGTVRRDLFGLVAQVTDPAGSTRRWRYDANGNVISETDADGAVWRFEYVSWNLLDRRIDPVDAVTTYQYTRSERLSRLEDPGGTTTGLAYDLKDRLVALSRAESAIETRRYDAADSLIEKADDRGTALIRVERGPEGLPVKAQYHSGEEWTFAYDDQGRLADAIGASSVEHREYDLLGHVMCDLRDGLGVRHKFSPTRLSRTEVLGRFVTSYRRSEAGLRTVIDPSGKEHTLQFLGDGLFLRTQSNGERELCQYDWRGRSLAKIVFGANRPAWSRQYRYSPAGDLISVDDTSAGPATYSYDAAHRLARVESAGGEHAFGYDPAGNLLYGKGLSGVVVRHNQLTAANGSTYQYDGRGQVARRQDPSGVTEFRYNSADLLVGVQGPSGDWEASYDSFGRRISKKGNNGVTRFYWDRERLAAEIGPDCRLRVYVYYDADARSPFLFVEYESAGADPASGQRYFVFTNQVGCPVRVKDESGATVWRAAIDPYGAAAIHPDSVIELNLRYPGHYFDPETGLHSNRWRYYSPELGRYIQPDPIGIDGGANVYAYAARPLIEVDLDGLACPKPMVLKPDDEEAFRERQAEAVRLAAALREAMMDADTGRVRVDAEGNETPITAHDNTTLAVLVVQRQGEYDIVVASSAGLRDLPENVQAVLGDTPMVAPPPRAPGTVPETGDTGLHAEQRGVRAMDNASNVDGVASVTPTRPCCPGCAQSIRDRGDPNLDSVSPIPGLSKER